MHWSIKAAASGIGILLLGVSIGVGVPEWVRWMEASSAVVASPGEKGSCPKDWSLREGFRVTGYYVPRESDFSGPTQEITINSRVRQVSLNFLKEVDDHNTNTGEGWGQTREGDFIGRYGPGGSWISSVHPLDAMGHTLKVGTVAVDPAVIPFGSKVKILTLPKVGEIGPRTTFKASVEGDSVNGRHIDVYTGVGAKARQAMFALTSRGKSAMVCVQYKK